jgi:DNA-binding MarR family transcriptional regulator
MDTDRSLGYTLHRLGFVMDRQSDMLLQEKFGIGFSQFKIMIALLKHEGIQQREIAEFLGQTEASISRQIKAMSREGLILSRRDAANRRQRITSLTAKGGQVATSAIAALDAHFSPIFERLSESEQASLQQTLDRLMLHICNDSSWPTNKFSRK